VLLPSSCVDQHMPASALLRRWQQRRNLITKLGVLTLLCILLAEAACAFSLLELGHVSVAVHTHNPGFLERAKRVDMRQFDETLPKWRARSSTAPFIGMTLRTSQGQDARGARLAGGWMPSMPQMCEDDYECNDGKANFPLQCCELPVLGKFCCEPDEFRPIPSAPAHVTLPVSVQDQWPQ